MTAVGLRAIRKHLDWLKVTPLHPKWLLQPSKRKIRALKTIKNGLVLDIGCSNRWAKDYLGPEAEYVGLDYPATSRELYGTIPDVFADASALPFSDGTFDAVLLFDVLEHLERPNRALLEIERVLQKKGSLFLAIPFLYPIHDAPYDFQRLTAHGLKRDLYNAGFKDVQVVPDMGAIETAGLLACIALTAVVIRSTSEKRFSIVLAPLVVPMIPIINIFSWLAGRLFPSWHSMTAIYWVTAQKS